jgi:hypothetical protein
MQMIAFVRTAGIAPGKTASAIAFAHEIAAYMKSNYGVELEVMLPVGGNPARIAWSARYENLAALETVNAKSLTDKRYWEIVGKNIDLFMPGSLNDAIWRSV